MHAEVVLLPPETRRNFDAGVDRLREPLEGVGDAGPFFRGLRLAVGLFDVVQLVVVAMHPPAHHSAVDDGGDLGQREEDRDERDREHDQSFDSAPQARTGDSGESSDGPGFEVVGGGLVDRELEVVR